MLRFVFIAYLLNSVCYAQLPVYVGGVNKLTSMIDAKNSKQFRRMRGGLYLHNSGWTNLTDNEKHNLLKVFDGHEILIEIGYGPGWAKHLEQSYWTKHVKPKIIISNFQAGGVEILGEDAWLDFCFDINSVYPNVPVLPNFEYANLNVNHNDLNNHWVSRYQMYKRIVTHSKGLSIDAPPGNFWVRDEYYKMWVLDAIRYCSKNKYTSVLIISPHKSGPYFRVHSYNMLRFLYLNNCFPDIIVVENYTFARDYYNKIGSERQTQSVLGVAKFVAEKLKAHKR